MKIFHHVGEGELLRNGINYTKGFCIKESKHPDWRLRTKTKVEHIKGIDIVIPIELIQEPQWVDGIDRCSEVCVRTQRKLYISFRKASGEWRFDMRVIRVHIGEHLHVNPWLDISLGISVSPITQRHGHY